MKVRVLGCSGGISRNQATTSFLVDDDILIDAGTGVGTLTLDEMHAIKHVFITHSHLDHIASIALLVDTVFDNLIGKPLIVHGLPETIQALQTHIFNWSIWPDFTTLPNNKDAVLRFESMQAGTALELDDRLIEMIEVNHVVPAVAYCVTAQDRVFAFSGDTSSNDTFWQHLNQCGRMDLLFVETAFADQDIELAKVAKHYCPQLLAQDLLKLKHRPRIHLTHLKPGFEQDIVAQCQAASPERDFYPLKTGDSFDL